MALTQQHKPEQRTCQATSVVRRGQLQTDWVRARGGERSDIRGALRVEEVLRQLHPTRHLATRSRDLGSDCVLQRRGRTRCREQDDRRVRELAGGDPRSEGLRERIGIASLLLQRLGQLGRVGVGLFQVAHLAAQVADNRSIEGGGVAAGKAIVFIVPGALAKDAPAGALLLSMSAELGGVGATVVAGDSASAGSGGLIAAIRGDDGAKKAVSTVDDATGALGQLTVALATADAVAGRKGQYGMSAGADALVPDTGQ